MKRLITLLLTLSLLLGNDGINDFLTNAGSVIADDDRIHFLDISNIGNIYGQEYVTVSSGGITLKSMRHE